MEKSCYSEADGHSTNPEIIWLLWNQNCYYCVQNSLPLDPILSHLNTLHNLTPIF
jgi:hypothetical protein